MDDRAKEPEKASRYREVPKDCMGLARLIDEHVMPLMKGREDINARNDDNPESFSHTICYAVIDEHLL